VVAKKICDRVLQNQGKPVPQGNVETALGDVQGVGPWVARPVMQKNSPFITGKKGVATYIDRCKYLPERSERGFGQSFFTQAEQTQGMGPGIKGLESKNPAGTLIRTQKCPNKEEGGKNIKGEKDF